MVLASRPVASFMRLAARPVSDAGRVFTSSIMREPRSPDRLPQQIRSSAGGERPEHCGRGDTSSAQEAGWSNCTTRLPGFRNSACRRRSRSSVGIEQHQLARAVFHLAV
jgi:hypothetical protein